MALTAGSIGLDLEINKGGFNKQLASVTGIAKKAASKITSSLDLKNTFNLGKSSSSAKKAVEEIGRSTAKVGKKTEKLINDSSQRIQAILEDTNRSMKSKAASIGAIYKQQGMSASDAMTKAWEQIERGGKDSEKAAKSSAKGIQNSFEGASIGISSAFKKLATVAIAAFSIHKIVEFGASCLQLGSDLQEVQNVVDVTFPHMSKEIDQFAQNAASQFGLSETMAKKFAGTFGSMAEAFGFSEKEAAKMSTTLTGLAGDVASFYNISQDEAYTKLKSVFSGETETLKDLGIVMTQSALDAWAMANGFDKTTKKMSEAEKVSLRLAFVQSQLANATGDFARTSNSWANQTRILSLQFDSLRASIGQGLINLFTPIIIQINALMKKLVSLAALFKQFTELITGKKNSADGIKAVAQAADSSTTALGKSTGAANALSKATKKAGDSAKKAAKEMLGIAGFDELNNFSKSDTEKNQDTDGGSGAAGGTGGGLGISAGDTEGVNDSLKKMNAWLEKIRAAAALVNAEIKKLVDAFKKGFQIGLGNTKTVFASIKSELASIGKSFQSIISNKGLRQAIQNWATSLASLFGTVSGAIASVGLTIADNLLGGISLYLKQHKNDLTKDLTAIFNISSERKKILSNFVAACADIFTVFRSPEAKQITADLINIFVTGITNAVILFEKFSRDVGSLLTKPIVDNKDKIKTALQNTIAPLSTVIGSISTMWSKTWAKIQSVYDTKVKPLVDAMAKGISGWMGTFLDGYNKYIAPVLKWLAEKFKSVMEKNIQPAINAVIDAFGDFCDMIKAVWQQWFQPFVNWVIKNAVPLFANNLKNMGAVALDIFAKIGDAIKGVAGIFSGICQTITGLANGSWKQAWEGVKTAAKGVWDAVVGIFSAAWIAIKAVFEPSLQFFSGIWVGIQLAFKNVKSWFKEQFSKAWNSIKDCFKNVKSFFASVWGNIKSAFSNTKTWFKTSFTTAFNNIKGAFSTAKSTFQTIWKNIKAPFSSVASFFETTFKNAWTKVKNVFSSGGKIFTGIKEGIASTFKTIVNGLISGINAVVKKPFDAINGMLNKIRDVGIGGVKPFSSLWSKDPISIPAIPKLAMGGYVKANTPQLAMIGDNRHQGEVVSPEDKLQEMADIAASKSGEVTAKALIPVIERLCNAIIELENSGGGGVVLQGVSDSDLYRIVKRERSKEKKRGV